MESTFARLFNTEEACQDYLAELRWGKGFICPRCSSNDYYLTGRALYRCKSCNLNTSLRSGTIFHGSRISLKKWFRALWDISVNENLTSISDFKRRFNLSRYQTVWNFLTKLKCTFKPVDRKLSGSVEIGDFWCHSTYTPPNSNSNETQNDFLIIMIERKVKGGLVIKRLPFTHTIEMSHSLVELVEFYIEPQSSLMIGPGEIYKQLSKSKYKLRVDKYLETNKQPPLTVGANIAFNQWLTLPTSQRPKLSYIDFYAAEYCFKANFSHLKPIDKFNLALSNAIQTRPKTAKSIKGRK